MPKAKRKPYFSPTQLDMLTRCGEQYRRRYIEGEKIPPGAALLQGAAMHDVAATNFRQKIYSARDLKVDDMVEMADANFTSKLAGEGIWLSAEERSRGQDVVIEESRARARGFAQIHAQQQAPDYQPEMVEERHQIELPGPYDLLGILDLADNKKRLVDLKTASRKKYGDDAEKSVQLTVYAAIYRQKRGEMPSEIRLDVAVQTAAGNCSRQVLATTRARGDFEALINRINTAARIVQAGAFMPAEPGNWICSPKFCGYWDTCRYVNSERKAAANA